MDAIETSLNTIYPNNELSLDFNDVEDIKTILDEIPPQTEKISEDDIEQPIHTASNENWYKLYNKVMEENNSKENTFNQFKWQNSQIRKHFLINMDIPINLDEVGIKKLKKIVISSFIYFINNVFIYLLV